MVVEETIRVEVPSPTPIISECAEEVPVLEESGPTPLVHEEIVGSTETFQVEEILPLYRKGWI